MKLKFEEQATPSNNIQIGDMFAYRGGTGLVYMRCRDDKMVLLSGSEAGSLCDWSRATRSALVKVEQEHTSVVKEV